MLKLCATETLQEAYLLRDLLRQHGIAVEILNEHAHGALGELPFVHAYPELWLSTDDALPRARELIERRRRNAATGERRCRHCGEANPSTFEFCWHCGTDLKPVD